MLPQYIIVLLATFKQEMPMLKFQRTSSFVNNMTVIFPAIECGQPLFFS